MTEMKNSGKKQSVTMHEIARLAGVSQSTVSRVLNGKTSVDPEKQAAVLKMMEALDYRPNVSAQGLVSGKTLSIGILTRYFGSPFFAEILGGVTAGLSGTGYLPIIALGTEVPNEDINAIRMLLGRQIDGLILQAGKHLSDEYLQKLAAEIPLVVLGKKIPGIEKQCVYVDSFGAAYQATSYLIEKGHTGIAHISGQLSLVNSIERRDGYCQALLDHGLEVNPDLIVEGEFTELGGTIAAEKLLARRKHHPFSAIFVANDQMVIGTRLVLYRQGIHVPDEVSLIGFDDQPNSQYMLPPLTTIRFPTYDVGSLAAQAMLAMLTGTPIDLPEPRLELVIRESVAIRQ